MNVYPKAIIDRVSVKRATEAAIQIQEEYIEKAAKAAADLDKLDRISKGLCSCCYYINTARIGCTITVRRECGICNAIMSFGNTSTDILCLKCAIDNKLCMRCGADLYLRPHRKYHQSKDIVLS